MDGTIFGEGGEVCNIKDVLIFATILSEIFLILRRIQRDNIMNVPVPVAARSKA